MSGPFAKIPMRRLIVGPAVITLAVTLLRLVGELQHWSPRFFSREAGGAGALIGIVWLVPIFGIYFAIRLNQAGQGPSSRGRAIGFTLAGLVAGIAIIFAFFKLALPIVATVVLTNLAFLLPLWIAYRGWPQLGKVEVFYGLSARIPVAILMFIAMAASWGTHYEQGPPGFPTMSLFSKWFLIGFLPQIFFWIAFTVIVGLLFGSLALLFQRRRQADESMSVDSAPRGLAAHP